MADSEEVLVSAVPLTLRIVRGRGELHTTRAPCHHSQPAIVVHQDRHSPIMPLPGHPVREMEEDLGKARDAL